MTSRKNSDEEQEAK